MPARSRPRRCCPPDRAARQDDVDRVELVHQVDELREETRRHRSGERVDVGVDEHPSLVGHGPPVPVAACPASAGSPSVAPGRTGRPGRGGAAPPPGSLADCAWAGRPDVSAGPAATASRCSARCARGRWRRRRGQPHPVDAARAGRPVRQHDRSPARSSCSRSQAPSSSVDGESAAPDTSTASTVSNGGWSSTAARIARHSVSRVHAKSESPGRRCARGGAARPADRPGVEASVIRRCAMRPIGESLTRSGASPGHHATTGASGRSMPVIRPSSSAPASPKAFSTTTSLAPGVAADADLRVEARLAVRRSGRRRR